MDVSKSNIEAIAENLANRVKDDKTPYSKLRWIVENCQFQYQTTASELWQAYFAAINLLKRQGVENAKRKPLSTLTPSERKAMRLQAKEIAAFMQKGLGWPVEVTRSPVKTRDGESYLQIEVKPNHYTSYFFYPTFEQLKEWSQLNEACRAASAYSFAQQFKSQDDLIKDNLETIKANLDCLL